MNNSIYKNELLSNAVFPKITSLRTPFSFNKTWRNAEEENAYIEI